MGLHSSEKNSTEFSATQKESENASKTIVTRKKSAGAFRTIGEVSDILDVPQHVLRFWESKFPQIRPLKRGGGRRYYRPEDLELLKTIHHLLYTEGYKIKGVQKLLKSEGKNKVVQNNKPVETKKVTPSSVTDSDSTQKRRTQLQSLLSILKDLKQDIENL